MNHKDPICARVDIQAWIECYDDRGDPCGPAQWKVHVKTGGRLLRSGWMTEEAAKDAAREITGTAPRMCPWCITERAQPGYESCEDCAELHRQMALRPESAGRLMAHISQKAAAEEQS